MARLQRARFPLCALVSVSLVALVTAACGSNSGSSDDSSDAQPSDSGADALADAGAASDQAAPDSGGPDATTMDAGDATIEADASPNASADAAPDALDASVPDVIAFGAPTCALQSGSRIKIRRYEDSDSGARIFDSMYDTMIGAPCAPATTSDGKLRCLPVALPDNIDFGDQACSTPIYRQADGVCSQPSYVGVPTSTGACTAPTVAAYQVGDALPDGGPVFQQSGSNCVSSSFLPQIYTFYSLSPVPDSMFVEGTASTAAAGNYSFGEVDFSDGARYCDTSDGFTDRRNGYVARALQMADGTYRMVPQADPSFGFAEGTCTTPATLTGSASPSANACGPVAPYTEDFDQCTEALTVRAIGAELDAGWFTQGEDDGGLACLPAPALPEGGAWNALSAPLPPSTFDLVATQPSGTGSAEELAWATYGGFQFLQAHFGYDSKRAAICSVPYTEGATEGCLPLAVHSTISLYTDGTCTTPFYVVNVMSGCVPNGFPTADDVAFVSACPSSRMVHVGTPYSGLLWQKVGKTCNQVGFPGQQFWNIVDDIDPSTYPQLTAVIE